MESTKELKAYNFECYFKEPISKQNGWEIKFPTIFAYTKEEAKNILKNEVPLFDCIILFNYEVLADKAEIKHYEIFGRKFVFYKHIYNRNEKGIYKYEEINYLKNGSYYN